MLKKYRLGVSQSPHTISKKNGGDEEHRSYWVTGWFDADVKLVMREVSPDDTMLWRVSFWQKTGEEIRFPDEIRSGEYRSAQEAVKALEDWLNVSVDSEAGRYRQRHVLYIR